MKTRIIETTCPADSQLRSFLTQIDFEDAFAFDAPVNAAKPERMEEVYTKIFNTAPSWVAYAMRLRNLLVSPFGLKTEIDQNPNPSIIEGEKAGIFKIYKIHENEVIAGENDKHLDFRVSVHRSPAVNSAITVSTMVQYHNLFGRIYMTLVMPFHKMVVKSVLKSAVKRFQIE